jgi:hypothetical protein
MITRSVGVMVSGLLACALGFGQTPHFVWSCALSPTDPNDTTDCHSVDTTVMGGVRFDDYRVTNPSAVQFDPALRLKELTALEPSNAAALCAAPPTFIAPAPTITFDQSSVVGQIYWTNPTASFTPSEFMDVQFANLKASNGFTSQKFVSE